VWAWRFVRSYGVIFEPWRVLRCALRVLLPFSLDFSPFFARLPLVIYEKYHEKEKAVKSKI
jgi:hypothetical protein